MGTVTAKSALRMLCRMNRIVSAGAIAVLLVVHSGVAQAYDDLDEYKNGLVDEIIWSENLAESNSYADQWGEYLGLEKQLEVSAALEGYVDRLLKSERIRVQIETSTVADEDHPEEAIPLHGTTSEFAMLDVLALVLDAIPAYDDPSMTKEEYTAMLLEILESIDFSDLPDTETGLERLLAGIADKVESIDSRRQVIEASFAGSQVDVKMAVKCNSATCADPQKYLITEDHLCLAFRILDLNPKICCRGIQEGCTDDCCVLRRDQVLEMLNSDRGKLVPQDLLTVLLVLDVSTWDIDPQRMLLALSFLNQIRFETKVLCEIRDFLYDRASHPKKYPGWAAKPVPVQVVEAAGSLGVVPHDIPERLIYPLLAAGNFSSEDQENLLTLYVETMKVKQEADIARVAYLLYQYKPKRRKDLWSSFERKFKLFSGALGDSMDVENVALSIYGGDFGLGVVADSIRDAAKEVDMEALLKQGSAIPELKSSELAAKDEIFVAAIYSLTKERPKIKTIYWAGGVPVEYSKSAGAGLVTSEKSKGVNIIDSKGANVGFAMLAGKGVDSVSQMKIFLNNDYSLMPFNSEDKSVPGTEYRVLFIDINANLLAQK